MLAPLQIILQGVVIGNSIFFRGGSGVDYLSAGSGHGLNIHKLHASSTLSQLDFSQAQPASPKHQSSTTSKSKRHFLFIHFSQLSIFNRNFCHLSNFFSIIRFLFFLMLFKLIYYLFFFQFGKLLLQIFIIWQICLNLNSKEKLFLIKF